MADRKQITIAMKCYGKWDIATETVSFVFKMLK